MATFFAIALGVMCGVIIGGIPTLVLNTDKIIDALERIDKRLGERP